MLGVGVGGVRWEQGTWDGDSEAGKADQELLLESGAWILLPMGTAEGL